MRIQTIIQTAIAFVLIQAGVTAQQISFGVTGGLPMTSGIRFHDQSRWYLVGPSIEVALPHRFAVEADGLYRRIGYGVSYSTSGDLIGGPAYFISRDRGNVWEVPILGKYYFRSHEGRWSPFAAIGPAWRISWMHNDTSVLSPGRIDISRYSSDTRTSVDAGAVLAAGLRWRIGKISITPEVRYNRWFTDTFNMRRDEGKALLGIRF